MSSWGEATYWIAMRTDESFVGLNADSVSIKDGSLCFWRESRAEGVGKPRTPFTKPQLVFSIAVGGWSTFWAASVHDGRALVIDSDSAKVDGCQNLRDCEVAS
jgi:hypothetical protein